MAFLGASGASCVYEIVGRPGLLLVPHTNGQVRSELLAAARVYDPDYVVTLERTLRAVEQLDPGTMPIRHDGELLVGEGRDRFIEQNGDFPLPDEADERARRQVAEFCSPYHRRDPGEGTEWDEDFTTLPGNADVLKLTKVASRTWVEILASAHQQRGRVHSASRSRPGVEPSNRQPLAASHSWLIRTSSS